jgi:hypothetical protein
MCETAARSATVSGVVRSVTGHGFPVAVAIVVTALASGACDGSGLPTDGDADADGDTALAGDSGTDGDADAEVDEPCPATPCPEGQYCGGGVCLNDEGPCGVDDDCINDSACVEGRCIPFDALADHDPECEVEAFEQEAFEQPVRLCEWTTLSVMTTPLVIDLDLDGTSEIVFTDFDRYGDEEGRWTARLVAIRGTDCQQIFRVAGPLPTAQLAAGNLDADPHPEIVAIDREARVLVYDFEGTLIATSESSAMIDEATRDILGGPALANLDGEGPPEIIFGGMALRLGDGVLETLYNVPVAPGYGSQLPVVADVDLDGRPEVLIGPTMLDGATGADETPATIRSFPNGFVAVADLDGRLTPEPEIVLVSSSYPATDSSIRVYNPLTGAILFQMDNAVQRGGPPSVADFDADGEPEIGVSSVDQLTVFDPGCTGSPLPERCLAEGILWQRAVMESWGMGGAAVFDFNGDHVPEVMHRDICYARIFDGLTGEVLFEQPLTMSPRIDYPTVADVDGDGHAEFAVACEISVGGCPHEYNFSLQGLFVYEDPEDRWVGTRSIWNQHGYHITNIDDDGTIPEREENSWDTWNSYRQNSWEPSDDARPAADLTARWYGESADAATDCADLWVLRAEVCNRGALAAPVGVAGTFYLGDPDGGGAPLCSTATVAPLMPGECTIVSCEWPAPETGAVDLWFLIDVDGTRAGAVEECHENNNTMREMGLTCPGTLFG